MCSALFEDHVVPKLVAELLLGVVARDALSDRRPARQVDARYQDAIAALIRRVDFGKPLPNSTHRRVRNVANERGGAMRFGQCNDFIETG